MPLADPIVMHVGQTNGQHVCYRLQGIQELPAAVIRPDTFLHKAESVVAYLEQRLVMCKIKLKMGTNWHGIRLSMLYHKVNS